MKTLPNGLRVFNATPHVIRFWAEEGWDKPIEIESDAIISAVPTEEVVGGFPLPCLECGEYPEHAPDCPTPFRTNNVMMIRTVFEASAEGHEIIAHARELGADIIVGSIIAAQAYPGMVVAMTPAPGYERVPPAEKRMNPDKFTVYPHE